MKAFLETIRVPDKNQKVGENVIHTGLIFLSGILLGIFSKWLDSQSMDDAVLWQHIFSVLDLRNVFSDFGVWIFIAVTVSVFSKTPLRASCNVFLFFTGMTVSYHLYTVFFCGFNPVTYMMIWYGITAITPILAYICWYAKGKGKLSVLISCIILSVMVLCSFGIGMWYFDFKSILDTLFFLGTVSVLYVNPKRSVYTLAAALGLSFVFRIFL